MKPTLFCSTPMMSKNNVLRSKKILNSKQVLVLYNTIKKINENEEEKMRIENRISWKHPENLIFVRQSSTSAPRNNCYEKFRILTGNFWWNYFWSSYRREGLQLNYVNFVKFSRMEDRRLQWSFLDDCFWFIAMF